MGVEPAFFVLRLRSDQFRPPPVQRNRIRRDHPGSPRHHARAVVGEQVFELREPGPRAGCRRKERCACVARAGDPPRIAQRQRGQRLEFLLSVPFRQRAPAHRRQSLGRTFDHRGPLAPACRQHDAHRLLHALEQARCHLGLVAFGGCVDDPDLVAAPPQRSTHRFEAGPVQEAGHGDERDDAVVRRLLENLPCGPPPEVDIQVAQVLRVRADAPRWRRHPRIQRGELTCVASLAFDPAATAFGLFFVGRVADDDHDGLVALDDVGRAPLPTDGCQEARKPAAVVVWIRQGVGHEHARQRRRREARQRGCLGEHTQLGHREGAELEFERDDSLHRRGHCRADGALALVGCDRGCDVAQHAEHEGAGAGGGVGHRDLVRGDAAGQRETGPTKHLIDQPHHA